MFDWILTCGPSRGFVKCSYFLGLLRCKAYSTATVCIAKGFSIGLANFRAVGAEQFCGLLASSVAAGDITTTNAMVP